MDNDKSGKPKPGNAADLDAVLHLRERTILSDLLHSQEVWILFAVIVICIGVGFIAPTFVSVANLSNVLQNFSFTALLAIGMTPVIMSGGIDISVGSNLGLCGISLAMLMSSGFGFWPSAAAVIVIGAAAGMVNGVLITYLKMPPFIVTLGMLSMLRSLTLAVSNNQVFYDFGPGADTLTAVGSGHLLGIPTVLWAVIVVAVLMQFSLSMTAWGRHVKAIGGNEGAARLTGIPVDLIKLSVYVLLGAIAGITSIFLLGWLGAATNVLGTGQELQAIAGAVIGGANLSGGFGSAPGAIVGSLLIEVIRNSLLLAGVDPFWQGMFVGGFIIFAVWLERLRMARQ